MSIEERVVRRRLDPAARREELLTAAAGIFEARPYADVTMGDVGTAAGASEALVFRYFATKAELYAEVVRRALAALGEAQVEAIEAAGPGQPVMAQLRLTTRIYVDFVGVNADNGSAMGGAGEPPEAAVVRAESRASHVATLRSLLPPSIALRHEFALWGFVGFVDAACIAWVERGCPANERDPLVETCLGALEGALGDWGA